MNLQILIAAGQVSDPQVRASLRTLASTSVQEFMRVNPGANLHLRVDNEADVITNLRERSALGASPDLLITPVAVASVLADEGLTQPSSLEPLQLDPLRLRFLSRFRQGNRFKALPFLLQPSVACYNRSRLPDPPTTLNGLFQAAEDGHRFGLPLQMDLLFWTTTGFRAQTPLLKLLDGGSVPGRDTTLTPLQRQQVLSWLRWLYRANVNPNIQFMESSEDLLDRLSRRQLDWISCNATAIPRLRRALGSSLAVAELPGGDNGQPSRAFTRLQLISFGRDSTPAQRALAERFALFLLNDFSQNNLMERALGNLPVNRNVIVPVKEQPELAVLERSLQHSIVASFREGVRIRLLREPLMQLLKQNVYGGRSPEALLQGLESLARQGPAADPAAPSGGRAASLATDDP